MEQIEPAGYFDMGTIPFYYQADIDKLQSDINALNLALRANKEMLATETARADKAEKQRDELLECLEIIAGNRQCSDNLLSNVEIALLGISKMKGGA